MEAKLKQTVIEQTITLRDVHCRLLATRYLPLTTDERRKVSEGWENSRAFVESQTTISASNAQKPEPIPDRSNPGTFGLFYEDYDSDSDSDSDWGTNDTITDVSPISASTSSTDITIDSDSASTSESNGFFCYLEACWRSRKLILPGFIFLLLVLFDVYRLLTPYTSSSPFSGYDESIYNDKDVSADDWKIHWTNGVPSYTRETPAPVVTIKPPEYEIVTHEEKPPPAWRVVRETGYDLRPESSPDPPVAKGLLSGTLAVLSAGVFAADSYTWTMGWRGANKS